MNLSLLRQSASKAIRAFLVDERGGLALDAVAFTRTAGGGGADAAFTAVAFATGDSGTIRNFNQQSMAFLTNAQMQYSTAGAQMRIRSPLFHDMVQGLRFIPGESPTSFLLPQEAGQMLRPQDVLTVEMISNAASEVVAGVYNVWYQDLPGAAARLHHWGDIRGLIKNIKPLLVAAPEPAVGNWGDTVITTSEDLLKANTDYAVLGYTTNRGEAAIAIKGPDTGNLRIGGPGDIRTLLVENYFVDFANRTGLPMIPVINSANKGATFVSVFARVTGGTPSVQLILAELARNLP